MSEGIRWESDRNGDFLWDGKKFLGCVYERRPRHFPTEWRVLIGEDMKFFADVRDVLLEDGFIQARTKARQVLEEGCGVVSGLPAQELMEMTDADTL